MIISPVAIALIVSLVIISAVIIFLPVLQRILDISKYIYCNAKIRAIEAGLLNKDKYKELLDAKEEMECINSLEDTDYGSYLTKVEDPITSEKVESALNTHLKEIYGKIIRTVPDSDKKIFQQFLKFWDVKNIKSILRGTWIGLPPAELKNYIVPVGTLKESVLNTLVESNTMEEAVSELESTEYGKIISETFQDAKEQNTLLPVEAALDKYVLRKAYDTASLAEQAHLKPVKILIGVKAEMSNLKTIIKAVSEEVVRETVEQYLIDINLYLSEESLKNALRSETMDEVASALEGTPYAEVISESLPEYRETNSTFVLENALDELYSKIATDLSLRYPLGAGPTVRLIVDKEKDIKQIGAVLKYKIGKVRKTEDLSKIVGTK
ncbi:MAG: V-type ATPase subunit [Candidatus Undinarchaeales archaeon]